MTITTKSQANSAVMQQYATGVLLGSDVSADFRTPAGDIEAATGNVLAAEDTTQFTIHLGFTPKYFKLVNVSADSDAPISAEWFDGMAAGYYMLTLGNGTRTYVNTNDAIHVYPTTQRVTIAIDTNIVFTDGDLAVWEARA